MGLFSSAVTPIEREKRYAVALGRQIPRQTPQVTMFASAPPHAQTSFPFHRANPSVCHGLCAPSVAALQPLCSYVNAVPTSQGLCTALPHLRGFLHVQRHHAGHPALGCLIIGACAQHGRTAVCNCLHDTLQADAQAHRRASFPAITGRWHGGNRATYAQPTALASRTRWRVAYRQSAVRDGYTSRMIYPMSLRITVPSGAITRS